MHGGPKNCARPVSTLTVGSSTQGPRPRTVRSSLSLRLFTDVMNREPMRLHMFILVAHGTCTAGQVRISCAPASNTHKGACGANKQASGVL